MNDSVGTSIVKKLYKEIYKTNKNNTHRRRINTRDIIVTGMIAVAVLFFAYGAAHFYNVFINLRYDIDANLAQIDTQLQKRKNLIINLGKTVIDYAEHEREIFTYLAELRAAFNGKNTEEILKSDNNVVTNEADLAVKNEDEINWEDTLSKLMAIAERYPDLRLSENFQSYMSAILEFENKIAELRMIYNDSVNEYSTIQDQFPGNIYAAMLRFEKYKFFKVNEDENNFIEVKY